MGAKIIDGKGFAKGLRNAISTQVARFRESTRQHPGLAVVLVGSDPASEIYVRNKVRQTHEVGMRSLEYRLTAEATQSELMELIDRLNRDPEVHGILVQLPLPAHMAMADVLNAIDPAKDVDGFHVVNAGRLMVGEATLVPCTPMGCLMLLKDELGDLEGRRALVIGRSNIVGKPMAALLLRDDCTVTMAHSKTRDIAKECRRADIVIAAVGKPEFVQGHWIKPGAVVIDVGINRLECTNGRARVVGDVNFTAATEVAGAITPVPGGVGPMTIACLLRNTLKAAQVQYGVEMIAN